jgi:hypothetical protein
VEEKLSTEEKPATTKPVAECASEIHWYGIVYGEWSVA